MKRRKTQCNATQDMFEANENSVPINSGRKPKKAKALTKSVNSKPKQNRADVSAAKSDDRYYTDSELAMRYKVVRQTIWRWVNSGNFPEPIKLGPNTSRWCVSDILAYEASRGIASYSAEGEAQK